MIHRLVKPIVSNSFFLFGPRGSGKSTFLRHFFLDQAVYWCDLLDPETERRLALHPKSLEEIVAHTPYDWIVIDEVQKVPALLDIAHRMIEQGATKFALTGSSARKLKRGAANLLAGRAFVNYLFPFTATELGSSFSLDHALAWGTLPKVVQLTSAEEKNAFLRTYAHTYLKEEIVAEQLVRRLDPFRRFLEISAQLSGDILNYTAIARDVGTDVKTVQNYYDILSDTLVGFFLPAYHTSIRKQQHQNPKFYWFDTGVKRALDRTVAQSITPHSYGYGKLFEQFLIAEIHRLVTYLQPDYRLYYLKTKSQLEIDLLIDRPGLPTALIEIKSSAQVSSDAAHALRLLRQDFRACDCFVLSQDPMERTIDGIQFLPWATGLAVLGLSPGRGLS